MNDESIISPIVDLFREILYDILGLFLPGAALLLVLSNSPFETTRNLVEPIIRFDTGIRISAFIGASYVVGYAVQGFAGHLWGRVIVRLLKFVQKKPPAEAETTAEQGMEGISPAFLQVKGGLEKSELIQTLRKQIEAHCNVQSPDNLSLNEIEHLCYAIAGDRADDAFAFSFRADLSNGMFLVSVIASIQTLVAFNNLTLKAWFFSLLVCSVFAVGFALRAWTYFNIRGRIIYSIGLAVLCDSQRKGEEKSH